VSSVFEGYLGGGCDGGSVCRYDGWAVRYVSRVDCADECLCDECGGVDRILVVV
jgi:hypothetical protein